MVQLPGCVAMRKLAVAGNKQALAEVAAKTAVIGAFQPTPKGDDELSSSSAAVRSPGRCRFEPE